MSTQKVNKTSRQHTEMNSSESSSSKKDQLYTAVNFGLDFVANVAEGADVLAPLKAACRSTKSILDLMQAIDSNQEDWVDLGRRLKGYISTLKEQATLFETYSPEDRIINGALQASLIHYSDLLKNMHTTVEGLKAKRGGSKLGSFKAIGKVKISAEEIRKFNRDIEDRHRQFMNALGVLIALRVQAVERKIDAATIFQLPTVAFDASSIHNTCLNGTRKAVLQMISSWADDDTSEKPIFWLCDIAGSGKSTVAMSAVEKWREEGVLGGQFFFSIASNERSTTDKFCSTIARDLVHYIPDLISPVAEAVKQNPSFMRSSLDEQFKILVTSPLRSRKQRVVVVVDAVDECKSVSERRKLLQVLSMANNRGCFATALDQSRAKGPYQSLNGLISQDKRERIIEKANGLFIWASTACRMLRDETTLDLPEIIYDRLISVDKSGEIDDVYRLIFERIDARSRTTMCSMLALLLVAFEPLTVDDLEDLLKHAGIGGSVKALVQNLGSVLSEDQTTKLIHFRHPTLVEYLRRCSVAKDVKIPNQIYINVGDTHGQAASWCLKCFKSPTEGLRFNMCQIETSFYLNKDISDLDLRIPASISRKLRYASSHWLFHLAETDDGWRSTLNNEIQRAIQSPYVLYWMEILSLTGGVPRAISGLQAVTSHLRMDERIRSHMTEIRRFLIAFSVPIQDSVPHIYLSALPFTPRSSILHKEVLIGYKNTLSVSQGVEPTYPEFPRSIRGHKSTVDAIAFSPDGSKFISGSGDRTIQFWDAYTGQPLGEPLRGHDSAITVIVVSPDGSRIISGSYDGTISVWDAFTGHPLGTFRGHKGSVRAVAFSSGGSRIVSCSRRNTVKIWDAFTFQLLGEPFQGSKRRVWAVAFSPDGSQIFSGLDDKTIGSWDALTGRSLGDPLRGHDDLVYVIAFSPDGSRIISGSNDKAIRIWDAVTHQPLGEPLRGHNGWVNALAFSPDGSRIVSGSSDRTIRLWDFHNAKPLGKPLHGHEYSVQAVVFSPDGSQIVSGSSDGTIRLWDVLTGQPLGEPLQGHEWSIRSVAISPDGLRIVSGSKGGPIRLWDTATGRLLGDSLHGHTERVNAVAFSPDGSIIASGSHDKMIILWDAVTGCPLGEPLRGHDGAVRAIYFSRNGSRIVSGSDDKTIRLWDSATGNPLGETLRGHEHSIRAIAFSPDDSLIVSGSEGHTLQLWDVHTGQLLGQPLRGHQGWIMAVGFSPDGLQIVSGSVDNTVRLWDRATGQPLGEPLRGHEGAVMGVAFSPDGSCIASGSCDKTIRIWDSVTRQLLRQPLRGHDGWIRAISFSPDGSRIVSGSGDNTVRLWSTKPDSNGNDTNHDNKDLAHSKSGNTLDIFSIRILVPGFSGCILSQDGWVRSFGMILFWVPPENRHGLQNPHALLTIPTSSPLRVTRLDFTRFQCGPSWTNVRANFN